MLRLTCKMRKVDWLLQESSHFFATNTIEGAKEDVWSLWTTLGCRRVGVGTVVASIHAAPIWAVTKLSVVC